VASSGTRSTHQALPSFAYRSGVRLQGTIISCDASAGSEVIFLSHAARDARGLPRSRHGRRQILTTETTLALLGPAGERLRPHALLAGLGRPFALGELRLELLPSGHAPGAAALLCERLAARGRDGPTRLLYAGVVGPGETAAIRPAEAVCIDATFGARRFAFPAPDDARAEIVALAREALGAGRAPVILVEPGPGLAVATALGEAGVGVRAARPVVQEAAAYARAGLPAPTLQRFDGRLRADEALLWPPEARDAARLGALPSPFFIFASGWAADPTALAAARADRGVALADRADFAGLLGYVAATGAREVALVGATSEDLAVALRERGLDVYPVGAPRQIALFSGGGEPPAHVVSAV
jgi:hypothetical protein